MLNSKHIIIILITTFLNQVSFAQQHKEASADYENAQKTFNILLNTENANIGKVLNTCDSLIKAGETNGDYRISCLGYNLKGIVYHRIDKDDESFAMINKWKELASKNNDDDQYFNAYYYYCRYEKYINSAKALIAGQKMISEAREKNCKSGLAWAYEVQGSIALYILQDYPTASYHFKNAIDIVKGLNNEGPNLGRLYYSMASSLIEEHKFSEAEKYLEKAKKFYGRDIPADEELSILNIQLDNAYNRKVDVAVFNQLYQKFCQHKLYGSIYSLDTRLFYKIRWLIRTHREREALAYIPKLELAIDRYALSSDAYESLGDWHNCFMMKDSILMIRDNMKHEMRSQELAELDAELNTSQLSIESAKNKARLQYVIFGSITIIFLISFATIGYFHYRRRKIKLERERELFVRNITHQLRTPMTVVTGMVEQLKEHIPADDAIGLENVEATKRQSRKLQNLIMQLAKMSKTGVAPVDHEVVDLSTAPVVATTTKKSIDTPSLVTDTDKPSILLAEDTDDVAMMMYNMLQDNGYVVTRAVDGQEALDILQKDLPDLLITDVAMPRMDGLELMRTIRNDDTMCHLPIIVASARVEDSERMEGISAGAEVYLTKPFIPEELLLSISTMLEQRKRLRHSFANVEADIETEKIDTPQLTDLEKSFLDSVDKCIEENMQSENLNANLLADNLYTSVSTVNRKIKNITGMPVATYIRTRRLLKAKQLLVSSVKSISDIEIICGFNTQGHFSRLFKLETGMSPREYRQRGSRSHH